MTENIAKRWKELNGTNNWKGLLDPIDVDLRHNIILYGELEQAVYDTFIGEKKSAFAGAPKHTKNNFLNNVTLSYAQNELYQVTKYFYATSGLDLPISFILKSLSREAWSKESNWLGFIAVATDKGKEILGRRDVLIVWRGTLQSLEWVSDFDFTLVPAGDVIGTKILGLPLIHRGWRSIYTSEDARSKFNVTSARAQVLAELKRLLSLYQDEELSITITGHSLGAALATVNAIDIASNGHNKAGSKTCPVTAFVFASPKVGDLGFMTAFNKQSNLKVLRIKNLTDIVPNYPPLGYFDVGTELLINNTKSPYLKSPGSIGNWHNLEGYLHGIAGFQGSMKDFKLMFDRDIALVNKSDDGLKDEYLIPDSWWSDKNKSLVIGSDAHWKLDDHDKGNVDQ